MPAKVLKDGNYKRCIRFKQTKGNTNTHIRTLMVLLYLDETKT